MVTERRIERHELVLDVVRNWVKGTTNRLVFVENVGRYALYDSDHQVAVLEYCSKTARGGGGGERRRRSNRSTRAVYVALGGDHPQSLCGRGSAPSLQNFIFLILKRRIVCRLLSAKICLYSPNRSKYRHTWYAWWLTPLTVDG